MSFITLKNTNKKDKKIKFYSLDRINSLDCCYNAIFGERSNGKTYAVLTKIIENYYKTGRKGAYVRRYDKDVTGANAKRVFNNFNAYTIYKDKKGRKLTEPINQVMLSTDGKFDCVVYFSQAWYLGKYDEKLDKVIREKEPFLYGFALNMLDSNKGGSYPNVGIIFFEEFLTRSGYLYDEWIAWTNVLSTLIRLQDDVKIYMVGNTVDNESPYFREMGLTHIKQMKKGDIDVYTYGDSRLKVAVEYADGVGMEKPSDFYYAFDNPKLKMITEGAWEINSYPHLPIKYKRSEVLFEYYIKYYEETLHCEIVLSNDTYFTYVHKKTTPIKNEDKDIIFQQEYSPKENIRRSITNIYDNLGKKIYDFFIKEKVFYQDNMVGETMRHYLDWCENSKYELKK